MNGEDNVLLNGFVHAEMAGFDGGLNGVSEKLDDILLYLKNELAGKNQIIHAQANEIQRLRNVVDNKQQTMLTIQEQLVVLEAKAESNRQIINKLLGDISHYQNDIEWYKRTYEKRSIWGVMREKIAKVSLPEKNDHDATESTI
jgi:DNA repair exonuclease SbcCD ATPase subunit